MESWRYPDAAVLIFAKSPVRGKVKSRLWPVLGESGALELHKALIELAVTRFGGSSLTRCEMWISSDEAEDFFVSLCGAGMIHVQRGDDLGERMANAAAEALQRARYVVLLGADCPAVDSTYLEQALAALEAGNDIVFGPAEDGGYVLLGLRRAPAALFSAIPWGTSEVMAVTRLNLINAGENWIELVPSWDVDRPEDLVRLYRMLPDLKERLAKFGTAPAP